MYMHLLLLLPTMNNLKLPLHSNSDRQMQFVGVRKKCTAFECRGRWNFSVWWVGSKRREANSCRISLLTITDLKY
jgi:hypothetical protein